MAVKLNGAGRKIVVNQQVEKQINLINPQGKVDLSKDTDNTINLTGSTGKVDLSTGGGANIPVYSGDYEVIPKVEEDTTLATTGYAMAKDVVVKEIPHYEVKNSAGGITFTIGK